MDVGVRVCVSAYDLTDLPPLLVQKIKELDPEFIQVPSHLG